jgi:hypothetical protein
MTLNSNDLKEINSLLHSAIEDNQIIVLRAELLQDKFVEGTLLDSTTASAMREDITEILSHVSDNSDLINNVRSKLALLR